MADPMPLSLLSVGAITAVGLTAAGTAAAVRAGISGFAEHPYLVDQRGDRVVVAAVPVERPRRGIDAVRFADLAIAAARESLKDLGGFLRTPVPMVLALPASRP